MAENRFASDCMDLEDLRMRTYELQEDVNDLIDGTTPGGGGGTEYFAGAALAFNPDVATQFDVQVDGQTIVIDGVTNQLKATQTGGGGTTFAPQVPLYLQNGILSLGYNPQTLGVADGLLTAFGSGGGGGTADLILAYVNETRGVQPGDAEFNFSDAQIISGSPAVSSAGVAKNLASLYMADNEPFYAMPTNDGGWAAVARAWPGGLLMRTTSRITPAVWETVQNTLTLGEGTARLFVPVAPGSKRFFRQSGEITVYNSVEHEIAANTNIQVKYINGFLTVDVTNC